jgi:uncharacterized membrane protein
MALLYHPLLVHFPIALWMTSALFELLYLAQRRELYATMARWLIGLGLLGAAVSIGSGWVDLLRQEALGVGTALRLQHRLHSLLAYSATATYLIVFFGRWRRPTVAGWTILLSLLGAALIGITGFVGGELRKVM